MTIQFEKEKTKFKVDAITTRKEIVIIRFRFHRDNIDEAKLSTILSRIGRIKKRRSFKNLTIGWCLTCMIMRLIM